MEKLAIAGGEPVRKNKIFYGRQNVDESDIAAVSEALRSDLITCGPRVLKVERQLCELTGAKHAVMVANGTAALHLSCIAAGLGEGDEVITTPLTFAASANCALYCGARPVFADVEPDTYNISPESILAHITPRTKAVVAVDFTGQPVKLDEIRAICDRFGLILIEDAAHSIGSLYKGRPIGGIADMTTFSFHPVKTVTGGEGGAVLTNSDELFARVMRLRTHGIEHDTGSDEPWYYEQIELGFNYRMTDFQSALISSQLKRLPLFKARRREIVDAYNEAFAEMPEIIVQREIPESDTCRHLYIIQLELSKLACSRLEFFRAMSAENVQPQVHYVPVYWFPYYQRLGYEKGLCPVAEKVYGGIMSIPLFPSMTDQDVKDVIHAVKKIIENYRK